LFSTSRNARKLKENIFVRVLSISASLYPSLRGFLCSDWEFDSASLTVLLFFVETVCTSMPCFLQKMLSHICRWPSKSVLFLFGSFAYCIVLIIRVLFKIFPTRAGSCRLSLGCSSGSRISNLDNRFYVPFLTLYGLSYIKISKYRYDNGAFFDPPKHSLRLVLQFPLFLSHVYYRIRFTGSIECAISVKILMYSVSSSAFLKVVGNVWFSNRWPLKNYSICSLSSSIVIDFIMIGDPVESSPNFK